MSGAVDDDDVMQTVASGRAALGEVLSAAQTHLQKVFIVFVAGLMLSIYGLREFVWNELQADLFSRLPPDAAERTVVVATTPFDVILLQVKIGLVVGILLSIPLLIYYSRDALRRRGLWPADRVPRWQLGVIGLFSFLLFAGGVAYAYFLFFPLMFKFLAVNAIQSGFEPTYSIVKWAQFVFLLGLSFGLAAQLPLLMTGLSYTGIVPYETFRDRWKVAILTMFGFGALFSPPDPFTQIMWALPLVLLYAFSLGVSKMVVNVKRSRDTFGLETVAGEHWNVIAGTALLAGVATYALLTAAAAGRLDPYLAGLPAAYRPSLDSPDPVVGLSVPVAAALSATVVAAVDALAVFLYYLNATIDELASRSPAPANAGDPGAIDLRNLDVAGVRAAPAEAFVSLTEDEALTIASQAIDAGDHEKAQAVLDRFDEAEVETEAATAEPPATAAATADDAPVEADPSEEGGVFARTGAGMLSAFTEDEKTEDDVGGYLYDVAFILDSVTSKAIWIVGVFVVVMAATFGFLYTGGIKDLMAIFLSRLPEGIVTDQVDIVALHPVEALIFEIKLSTVIAFIATLPVFLYFAWPSLKERGFARGNRNVLLVWGVALFAGTIAGSVIGFVFVAPSIISYLAADVARANMIIAYRINNFGWLVFFTTVGVGLLADIPVTMFLFHRGGLVPFATMRRRWREVTLGVLGVVAMLSPRGAFMMFLIGGPVMLCYGLGLAILWLYTLGDRRAPGGGNGGQRTDTDSPSAANAHVLLVVLAVLLALGGATAASTGFGPLDSVSLDDFVDGETGPGASNASTPTPVVTPPADGTTASPSSPPHGGSSVQGPPDSDSLSEIGFTNPQAAGARETPPGADADVPSIVTTAATEPGDVIVASGTGQSTPTDSRTSFGSQTPSSTATPAPTDSSVEPAEPTPTPTDSQTPTDSSTPTDSQTPSPTPTDSQTPTDSPTPTDSSTPTDSQTPTDSPTPTDSSTPTDSRTPTPSPTATPSPTPSPTPSDPLDNPLGGFLSLF